MSTNKDNNITYTPYLAEDIMGANHSPDYIDYLSRLNQMSHTREYKSKTYHLLKLQPGHHVLDVGCGTGEDVIAMAKITGPNGRVVGIDNNEEMVRTARKNAGNSLGNIEFYYKEAYHLDFPDDSFDSCRIDRVLIHNSFPKPILAEMVRVAKPEAVIVACEPDFGTFIINSPEKQLTKKIIDFFCELFPGGWTGRQLYGLCVEAGLTHIQVYPQTGTILNYQMADKFIQLSPVLKKGIEIGHFTEEEIASWQANLQLLDQKGAFFASTTLFIVTGQKI